MASYSTSFSGTENPLSESGNWVTGATYGFNDCRKGLADNGSTNIAFGASPGTPTYGDSTALLTGTWSANQQAQATVYVGTVSASYPEVELRLRSAFGASSCTGYEVNFSIGQGAAGYLDIVRWNGALGNFTYLAQYNGLAYNVVTGDVIKATMIGHIITVWKNGTVVGMAADSTYSSGNPGVGMDYTNGGNTYGFTAFSAADGLTAASSYFGGNVNSDGSVKSAVSNDTGQDDVAMWNVGKTFTCPGSGLQNILELSVYCKNTSGSTFVLLAIFNAARTTKICEGAVKCGVGVIPYSWSGHNQFNIGSPQLTGGTNYTLCYAFAANADNTSAGYVAGTSGDFKYDGTTDRTGGFSTWTPGSTGTSVGNDYTMRCGVSPASATTHTITSSLDALIQRTGIAQTSSLDAMIQASKSATFSADALISAVKSGMISIDALAQAMKSQTISADALLQMTKNGILSVDAFLYVTLASSICVDAFLSAMFSSTTGLDAIISGTPISYALLDAIIQSGKLSTTQCDALIQSGKLNSTQIDALLQHSTSSALSFDGMLQRTSLTSTMLLDSIIQATKTGGLSLDAILVVAGQSGSLTMLDALILAIKSGTVSLDALLQRTGSSSTSIDAILFLLGVRSVSMDAILQAIQSKLISMDALLQITAHKTVSLDALISVAGAGQISMDAILYLLGTANAQLDGLLSLSKQFGVGLDAIIGQIIIECSRLMAVKKENRFAVVPHENRIITVH